MNKSAREMLDSPEFKQMVRKRLVISVVLTLVLFAIYYGYIVLVAVAKPFMSQKIGEVTTLGIPLGIGVILLAWALTAIYVVWANKVYDPVVRSLKAKVEGEP